MRYFVNEGNALHRGLVTEAKQQSARIEMVVLSGKKGREIS